ncbi:MAG: hypothetical protein JWM93_3086 [Frankiales bacterium]|nr:hypothetical protein [Frankiales bacterium]
MPASPVARACAAALTVVLTAGFTATAPAAPADAAEPATPPTAALTTFTIGDNVVTTRATTQFFGAVATSVPVTSALTTVTIAGKVYGDVRLYVDPASGGVDIPRAWGAGTVRLGPTRFTYADGSTSVDRTRSNAFYALRNVKTMRGDNIALTVDRRDDIVSFRVHRLMVLDPAGGRYRSLRRVTLQYLTARGWRTRSVLSLDSLGNGSFRRKITAKHRYRLLSPRLTSRVEFRSDTTGRI